MHWTFIWAPDSLIFLLVFFIIQDNHNVNLVIVTVPSYFYLRLLYAITLAENSYVESHIFSFRFQQKAAIVPSKPFHFDLWCFLIVLK